MIKVKFTPQGVMVIVDAVDGVALYKKPSDVQALIKELQEAVVSLVEHQGRSVEENQSSLWESV